MNQFYIVIPVTVPQPPGVSEAVVGPRTAFIPYHISGEEGVCTEGHNMDTQLCCHYTTKTDLRQPAAGPYGVLSIKWTLNFAITTQQKQTYVNLLRAYMEC